eukprot:scaffold599_cov130-Isochrysis_galbana.AAC.3
MESSTPIGAGACSGCSGARLPAAHTAPHAREAAPTNATAESIVRSTLPRPVKASGSSAGKTLIADPTNPEQRLMISGGAITQPAIAGIGAHARVKKDTPMRHVATLAEPSNCLTLSLHRSTSSPTGIASTRIDPSGINITASAVLGADEPKWDHSTVGTGETNRVTEERGAQQADNAARGGEASAATAKGSPTNAQAASGSGTIAARAGVS